MQKPRTWPKMAEAGRCAVADKYEDPEKDVRCPNCGEPPCCFERGNSYGARCGRCNCEDGARGV